MLQFQSACSPARRGSGRDSTGEGGDITTYSWSYENQLIQIEEPDDVITTQTYAPVTRNADELRFSKETDTGTTNFIWGNQNITQEVDELNSVDAEYTLNPQPYGNLISQRREDESTFYNYDALGSTQSSFPQTPLGVQRLGPSMRLSTKSFRSS